MPICLSRLLLAALAPNVRRFAVGAGARALAVALATAGLPPGAVLAQELLSGGDGAVTLFSGLSRGADGAPRPDPDGAVVRLLRLADPDAPADGALREAPRLLLSRTARDVGQVFAVAFDGRSPANIFLAASSAFGLYRTAEDDWAEGMWGPGGGPGTIWRLNAARGYRAERFADIGYLDQPNQGAGLGGLAYDPWHDQLFVSDLESGLIHRLDLRDGELLESFDHGVDGRAFFFDAASGEDMRRDPVTHDPTAAPRFEDCAVEFEGVEDAMPFDSAPECWNYADFRRRVWGLGVFRDGEDGPVRLYYAVWGGAGLGHPDWDEAGDEAATSIWSIPLTDGGWFDSTDVRREIVLPPIAGEAGERRQAPPVTGIVFTEAGHMVLAERGAPAPYFEEAEFTQLVDPGTARVLRLSRDADGAWQVDGRYQAGYPRREEAPELRANAAGGIAVPAGGQDMIWMTVDALCAADAPCPDAEGERRLAEPAGGVQATPVGDVVAAAEADADDLDGLARSYLFRVRSAGQIPGDTGAVALHPGDAPPVRVAEPLRRAEPSEPPDEVVEAEEPDAPAEPDAPEEAVDLPAPEAVAADLAVTKSALEECRPGEACRFEVAVENRGEAPFDGPLVLTDTLGSAGASLVSAEAEGWACHAANAHVFCRAEALHLAPAQSVTVALTVRLSERHREPRLENCAALTWLGRSGRERIRAVQAELNRRGFESGPVDGAMGPMTEGAIRRAEAAFDLVESGAISAPLIEDLFGEGAYMSGDADPDNDRDCATATVDVPPPPAQVQRPPAHGSTISEFHRRRASAQHNPATSAPTPVHRRAFSEFHMHYRSAQHDGIRSELVVGHDRVMSRFHQRFESRMHDIETSGPMRFHTIRDSAMHELHDGYTSRMPRVHEGWTSRWR